jgi:hypothetical protein
MGDAAIEAVLERQVEAGLPLRAVLRVLPGERATHTEPHGLAGGGRGPGHDGCGQQSGGKCDHMAQETMAIEQRHGVGPR